MRRVWWAGWAVWCLAWAAAAEVATTQVVQVEDAEVVLGAGRRDGLALEARVTLLRPGAPIVHPLTGQVLGVPQEPVGVARIFELEAQQARGVLEKTYSHPQVGDLAEYEKAAGEKEAAPMLVAQDTSSKQGGQAEGALMQRLKDLEQNVEQYQASTKTLKAYPVFAQRVWDEISTMKSYLVSIDERLVQLEEQQSQSRLAFSGRPGTEEMREFTVRYSPDTQVKLKVAGKTLLVSLERDSLRLEEAGQGMGEKPEPPAASAAGEAPAEEKETAMAEAELASAEPPAEESPEIAAVSSPAAKAWYESPWVLGTGVLVFGVIGGVGWWLLKRRFEGEMEELEELEADYLEDEEEEEEEEEEA